MAEDSLKNIPPEERIKKLKELEKKKKQEIEEAQKAIRESEKEITEKRKWKDKVPIPELAKNDLVGLSEEGKAVLKEWKGLEETVQKETTGIPTSSQRDHFEVQAAEYIHALSQKPAEELLQSAESLNRMHDEKGYLTLEEQHEARNLYNALNEKESAGEAGFYGGFTEEVATITSMTKRVTGRLLDRTYHTNKSSGNDMYKQ
ncbi:hypothetical protein COV17_03385 [Candidatus Woesearchaeota archaeon CG10_big_fil_rev_8_21_14_0_10_36_11]|nr:MAG: hypothetical protein COV17_03385 [Candidatus Woesearchaeota archaeon CG10_big_fil_rev_8_21_14_0_10_36_11]